MDKTSDSHKYRNQNFPDHLQLFHDPKEQQVKKKYLFVKTTPTKIELKVE